MGKDQRVSGGVKARPERSEEDAQKLKRRMRSKFRLNVPSAAIGIDMARRYSPASPERNMTGAMIEGNELGGVQESTLDNPGAVWAKTGEFAARIIVRLLMKRHASLVAREEDVSFATVWRLAERECIDLAAGRCEGLLAALG